jgi:hypothetical protein
MHRDAPLPCNRTNHLTVSTSNKQQADHDDIIYHTGA